MIECIGGILMLFTLAGIEAVAQQARDANRYDEAMHMRSAANIVKRYMPRWARPRE